MLWGGRREMATSSLYLIDGVPAMPQPNDLSRSLVALDQNSTIIAVIELSQSSWLVAGMLPGIERQPRKKLEPSPERLLGVAAWRTGPLQHGARADDCRRGRQAAEPRARQPGGGTHADCEPDKVHAGPAGHSQLQTNPAQGRRASCNRAHPGGRTAAAEHLGRAAARHGAAGLCRRPDQGDRARSPETIGAAA